MERVSLIIRIILIVAIAVAFGILVTRTRADSDAMVVPYCYEVKNENYSGPCVALMIDGVITGDEAER